VRSRALAYAFIIACLTVTPFLFGQVVPTAEKMNAETAVRLSVSTRQTKFYSGEVIPLDLSFSSAIPKRYQINMATYDRSGRMNYEEFVVEPKDATRDPLHLYFNSIAAFMGGGLTHFEFLTVAPTVIHLNLNEWVSLERPGTYKLRVVSRRVSDSVSNDQPMGEPGEANSNWIELTIVSPSISWQEAELSRIRQVLNQGTATNAVTPDETRQAALSQLRYLGTVEAAREMARRLRGEDGHTDFECMFGLIGSRHREAGLEEMNRLFENPNFPVTQMFLTTMSILPLDSTESPETLRTKMDSNRRALNEKLMNARPHKRGKASAVSLDTALNSLDAKTSEQTRKELVPDLLEAFSSLAIDQQLAWLQYRWETVKDTKWLSALRTIALQYKDYPQLRQMDAYQSLELSGTALKRWYELDPDGARDAVIKEIVRPKPRYDASVLGLLPDKALPSVEHELAQHFVASDNYEIQGNTASLLSRYADADVLAMVLGKVTENVGTWACDPQGKMLAYVLRVSPETAGPLIERAIAARGPENSACRHSVLTDIAALHDDPLLELVAIKSLADSDPEVALNAAAYLGTYGSSAAEQPLWERYEAWSREWSGREKELRFVNAGENPNVWQNNLGEGLARALMTGLGWLADDGKLRRVKELAVGVTMVQNAEAAERAALERPLSIRCMRTAFDPPSVSCNVAQYELRSIAALKTKLAQFPHGSTFVWSASDSSQGSDMEDVFKEISQFAAQKGIKIQLTPSAAEHVR
jgi:hypothetical protein